MHETSDSYLKLNGVVPVPLNLSRQRQHILTQSRLACSGHIVFPYESRHTVATVVMVLLPSSSAGSRVTSAAATDSSNHPK